MNVYTRIFLLLMVGCFTTVNSQNHKELKTNEEVTMKKNVLVVYLTRSNNTEAVANMITEKIDGDVFEVKPEKPYASNYQKNVDEVKFQNDHNILPPLSATIDISEYDAIFVGFPTWGMQLPPPIKTFLSQNNWEGKTVVPFNTNAGYGLGSSISQLNKYCQNAIVTDAFSVKGGHEREGILFVMKGKKATEVSNLLDAWLQKIGF
ncbi:flavodoxin [Joostella sp. CR20]|uniref:flavodoxin n=1 Tax=Joostella sp. CR20 TaxID=2804312 RepID=UPI00313C7BAE